MRADPHEPRRCAAGAHKFFYGDDFRICSQCGFVEDGDYRAEKAADDVRLRRNRLANQRMRAKAARGP